MKARFRHRSFAWGFTLQGLKLLYVACESGAVSMFKADGGKLTKLGDAKVGPNSHTVAVDSKSHKVYFPLKNLSGAPVLRIMTPIISKE